MALDLWNLVRLEVAPVTRVRVYGQGADSLPRSRANLVFRAVARLYREAGSPLPPLRLTCRNRIPLARGLGSSAAAGVGGLVAANHLCGCPLSQERLLEIAAEMEGHPDNVAPALLGGCRIVAQEPEGLITAAVPLPRDLYAILYIPHQPMPTHQARAVLPRKVPRGDAIYNLAHVALLVHALHEGDLELLRQATRDRLHQPARQRLFPAMKYIFRAALNAGALGVFLSGGGSAVLALTRQRQLTIGYEMADAAEKMGVRGEVRVVRPARRGAHVVEEG